MPCRSDYMEPNEREHELTNINAFLHEFETGKLGKHYGTGMDPNVYNKDISQDKLNKATEELCTSMQYYEKNSDVTKLSLELQTWWRDHKAADLKRVKAELEAVKDEEVRRKALVKLTDHERKLLGY